MTKCEVTELHYRAGTSDKFYRVYLLGLTVCVQYGRRGTTGQWQVKNYSTQYQARNFANDQVWQKERKGYNLTGTATFDADASWSTTQLLTAFTNNRRARGVGLVREDPISPPVDTEAAKAAAEKERKADEAFKEKLLALRGRLAVTDEPDEPSDGESPEPNLESRLAAALAAVKKAT